MTQYAASISTETIILNRISFKSTAYLVNAANEYEATGKAIEFARQRWPENNGYFSHHAICMEVPDTVPGTVSKAVNNSWLLVAIPTLLDLIILDFGIGTLLLIQDSAFWKAALCAFLAFTFTAVKYAILSELSK